jgi:hypothetical protein
MANTATIPIISKKNIVTTVQITSQYDLILDKPSMNTNIHVSSNDQIKI